MLHLDFDRNSLPRFISEKLGKNNPKICEIGVFEGNYSQIILSQIPLCELFLLDLWDPKENDFFYSDFGNDRFDKVFLEVSEKFSTKENVYLIKGDSKDLHNKFEDGFFDWIYIDGDHSYEGVLTDLQNWFPKVKPGGVISGHDFDPDPNWGVTSKFGVNKAVSEFFSHPEQIHLTNETYYKSWVYSKNS